MPMWWRERWEKTFGGKEKRTGQAGGHSRERSHNRDACRWTEGRQTQLKNEPFVNALQRESSWPLASHWEKVRTCID